MDSNDLNVAMEQNESSIDIKDTARLGKHGTKPRINVRGGKKVCSCCGIRPHGPKNRYCALCHNAKARAWRKTHPLTPEQKFKDNARSMASVYLKRGKLKKAPCEVCGSDKSQMHHDDYSKPLVVRWLCRKHHMELHENEWRINRKPTEKQLQKVQMDQRKRRAA